MSKWRDTIRTEIGLYCQQNNTQEFELQSFLEFAKPTIREQFPKNNNWEAAVRRTLQELRDKDEIEFLGNGRYRVKEEKSSPSVWIEKTQVTDRPYKQKGELQLGRAIMSPSQDKGGRNRYEALRDADVGDIVVHYLQDKQAIVGVSTIESELEEDFDGPPTGRWTEKQEQEGGYLRWLTNYQELDSPIDIYDDILHNPVFEDRLRQIRDEEEKILYSKNLSINQGHYFTRCPRDLVEILAEASVDLAEQFADRGVDGIVDQPTEPADPYDGIVSATEDIRDRLAVQTGEQNWLGEQVAETIVAD